MRVADLMSPNPVTVPAHASLLEVQELMVVAHISGVPVAGPGGEVVGIIGTSDVLGAVDQALDEDQDPGEPEDVLERLQSIRAEEIATPDVVWVSADAPATEVARMMHAERLHHVLVGTRERLEGILSAFDLLRAV